MLPDKHLRLSVQHLTVKRELIVQVSVLAKRVALMAVPYFIYIFLAETIIPCMKIKRHLAAVLNGNIIGQNGIHCTDKPVTVHFALGSHIKAKSVCMNARIGTAAADYILSLTEYFFYGILHLLLNGFAVRLHLPAVVIGAVICYCNKKISQFFHLVILLWENIRLKEQYRL